MLKLNFVFNLPTTYHKKRLTARVRRKPIILTNKTKPRYRRVFESDREIPYFL
jgi:hypothetical protein